MKLYAEEYVNRKYLELEKTLEKELPALIKSLGKLEREVILENNLREEAQSLGNSLHSISVLIH